MTETVLSIGLLCLPIVLLIVGVWIARIVREIRDLRSAVDASCVMVEVRNGALRDTREMLERRKNEGIMHVTLPRAEARALGLRPVSTTDQVIG